MANILQQREIFHLEFLRALNRVVKPGCLALKGGSNLRFFFGSIRYSEDMDLDVDGFPADVLKERVMEILESTILSTVLKPFQIVEVRPPDLTKAKQTSTVQRFKVHLITGSGEDLFTKVEFSRRGLDPWLKAETVSPEVTRFYRIAPLIVPHYGAETALLQKIRALADRKQVQARDVFDIYVLLGRSGGEGVTAIIPRNKIAIANEHALAISFEQYRDTVVAYLAEEDQAEWGKEAVWDEIRLRVSLRLETLMKSHG